MEMERISKGQVMKEGENRIRVPCTKDVRRDYVARNHEMWGLP